MSKRPTYLYRHFGNDGKLLYVGISLRVLARIIEHKRHSPWFVDIATVTIQAFTDRQAAFDAERDAILKEQPAWNVVRAEKPFDSDRRRELDRARKRRERAKQGRMSRAQYLAKALSARQPWKAAGVSRATWYRRNRMLISPTQPQGITNDR